MLRRILYPTFFLIALMVNVFALNAEVKAPATKDAVVDKKRATNPKTTMNPQRFNSSRVGQVPLNQRVDVHYGRFSKKNNRYRMATVNKVRVHPKNRVASGKKSYPKMAYVHLQVPEQKKFTTRKRVGRVDQVPVTTAAPEVSTEIIAEQTAFSMADMNAYQYREDRSTEPGIPVQVAGGGD